MRLAYSAASSREIQITILGEQRFGARHQPIRGRHFVKNLIIFIDHDILLGAQGGHHIKILIVERKEMILVPVPVGINGADVFAILVEIQAAISLRQRPDIPFSVKAKSVDISSDPP